MLFGLQALKQDLNSVSGTGQTITSRNPDPSRGDIARRPVPASKAAGSGAPINPAKLNSAAAGRELEYAVQLARVTGGSVRDGSQITDLLSHLRGQYNKAETQQARQEIWRTIDNVMNRGTKVGLLATHDGKRQNAATYLGVSYDNIKAPAPLPGSAAPSSPNSNVTQEGGQTTDVTKVQTNPSSTTGEIPSNSEVDNDASELASIATDIMEKSKRADLPGLSITEKVRANDEFKAAGKGFQDWMRRVSSSYQDELFNPRSTATMEDVEKKYPLGKDFISKAAHVIGGTDADVQSQGPLSLILTLMTIGKKNPAALELGQSLLGALRKPTDQTKQSNASPSPGSTDAVPQSSPQPGPGTGG